MAENNPLGFDQNTHPPVEGDGPYRGPNLGPLSSEGTQGGVVGGAPDLAAKLAETEALLGTPPSVPISTDNSQGQSALPSPSRDPQATQDNLGKLDAIAEQAMKERGMEGYVPPLNSLHADPDGSARLNNAVTDFFAGFNKDLARVVALPEEVTARGLALLGVDYMQHGSPTQRTIDALNNMGIPAYEVDNLANKMGQDALPALATYAAMQISAPYMAANTGTGVVSHMAKSIGEWAIQHPVVGLWLGQTSSMGGTAVKEKVSSNPIAVLGGELAGGLVGSGAARASTKAGGAVARVAGKGVNWLADNLPGLPTNFGNAIKKYNPLYQPPNIASDAVARPGVGIHTIQNFADNQVEGLKMQMVDAIDRAISSVPQKGNSAIQSRIAHSNLQEAEKISNRIVSEAWAKTPMMTRIPVSDMRKDIYALANELAQGAAGARPIKLMREGLGLSSPIRDPNTGQMVKASPTIKRLRGYIADIRHEIVAEQASDAPRDLYIRNLNRLRDIVEDNISNAIPRDTSIAQARAASLHHHNMFSRGPIADILSKRGRGDFVVNPAESVDRLINTEGGLQAVRDMISSVKSNRLTSGDEKRILDELTKNIEATIRNGFREAAQSGGPLDAVKYANNNAYGIRAMAKVAAEMQLAAGKVKTAMDVKTTIEKSALARFAQTDPEKAVANIFAQKNPAEVARQLIRNFKGDPDALAGLRNAVVGELMFNRARSDPMKMRELLNSTRMGDLMQEVLSPDQWRRMNRIVNDSIRMTSGEDKGFRASTVGRFSILARIMGAQVGRVVNRASGGGGTIQIPGIFAAQGSKLAERIMKVTSPQDLMVNAILDPQWEHMLYSRLPISTKEMRAAALSYRRLYSVLDTQRQAAQDRLAGGKDE